MKVDLLKLACNHSQANTGKSIKLEKKKEYSVWVLDGMEEYFKGEQGSKTG